MIVAAALILFGSLSDVIHSKIWVSRDEPMGATSIQTLFEPKFSQLVAEVEKPRRIFQSSISSGTNISTFTSAVLVGDFHNKEPFTIGWMMLDLRHLSDYNGSFSINKEWTVSLNFTSEDKQIYSLFGDQFPEPGGFNISVDVPYFFSFMVSSS